MVIRRGRTCSSTGGRPAPSIRGRRVRSLAPAWLGTGLLICRIPSVRRARADPRSTSAVASAADIASAPLSSVGSGRAAAGDRLLEGVAGQHAVADRHPGIQRDPGQPGRHRIADVLEMRCATADHHAERDDGVVRGGQRLRHDRQLDAHPAPGPRSGSRPRPGWPAHTARSSRRVGDLAVPGGRHHPDPQPLGLRDLQLRPSVAAHDRAVPFVVRSGPVRGPA